MSNTAVKTYSDDEDALVQNSNITIKPISPNLDSVAILPRYYNCRVTVDNSNIMVNGAQDSTFIVNNSVATFNGNSFTTALLTNTNATVSGGANYNINTDSSLLFSTATGNNYITTTALAGIFGADGANTTLTSFTVASLFVAGDGNETLNGSRSVSAITTYASTTSDHNTNLVVSTGRGDDELNAGTGNSTFTGGAGNNLFVFNKDTDAGGKTVITDFAASAGNKISLYNYNLTQDSLNSLLANSHNDSNGNAILNLDNHQITVQGVSINNLHTQQFNI